MIHSGGQEDEVTLEERVVALEKWAEAMTETVVAAETEGARDDENPFEAQHQRMMARRRMEKARE